MVLHLGLNISTYMYTAELDTKNKKASLKECTESLMPMLTHVGASVLQLFCRKGHCQNSLNKLILWAAQMKK